MFMLLRQALSAGVQEWRREADIRVLEALNDHLLADIGLRREQLPTTMMETPKRKAPAPLRAPARRAEPVVCG